MKKIWNCRRSMLGLVAILCLTTLGLHHGEDISGISVAISGIVGAIAGANAWQGRGTKGS